METFDIRYSLTLQQFMAASSAHWRAHRQGAAFQICAGLLGIAVGITALSLVEWLAIALIIVGILMLCVVWLRWVIWRRAFRESRKYTEDIHVVANHDGLHIESAEGTSDLNWGFYSKYLDTRDYVILYMTRHSFSIIPKTAFESPEHAERFITLVSSHLEPTR